MMSRLNAFCACLLLLAIAQSAKCFSSLKTHQLSPSKTKIRPRTSLSVIMGGTGNGLTDIPSEAFGYNDITLENVNERAMLLFGQFQDAAASSPDGFAQVASVMASQSENFQDVIVGGSANTLAAIPESILDSIGNRMMTIDQLNVPESKIAAAATATAATVASTFTNTLDNVGDNSILLADNTPDVIINSPSIEQSVERLAESLSSSNVDIATSSAMQNSNNVLSLMEKTVTSLDDLAAKSNDSIETVARQLSDKLYENFGTIDAAQASLAGAPKFIAQKGDKALQEALDEANKIFESSTNNIVEKGTQTLQNAKNTPVKSILNNMVQVLEDIMKVILKTVDSLLEGITGSSSSGYVAKFQSSMNALVSDTIKRMSATVDDFGHVKLEKLAEMVFKEFVILIEGLAKIVMTVVDALLKTFTGDTALGHINHMQASFTGAVADASHQFTSGIHDLGQISLQEVAVVFLSFLTFVAKLLFQLASAIVVVVSGQGINEWTAQVIGALQEELSQALMGASTTVMGLTEKTVSEFGALMLQLLENTSVLLIEALQSLLEALGLAISTTVPLATGALASDTVRSVADSVSMITANMQ